MGQIAGIEFHVIITPVRRKPAPLPSYYYGASRVHAQTGYAARVLSSCIRRHARIFLGPGKC